MLRIGALATFTAGALAASALGPHAQAQPRGKATKVCWRLARTFRPFSPAP